eukprot:138730-Amphidinium_carterae.2
MQSTDLPWTALLQGLSPGQRYAQDHPPHKDEDHFLQGHIPHRAYDRVVHIQLEACALSRDYGLGAAR